MKTKLTIVVALFFLAISFSCAQSNEGPSPLDVVNKRMSLYNAHDFSAFIKLYHKDVEVYTYPEKLLGKGVEKISSIFEPKFASKSIHVEIVSQMNNGSHVINHEIVTEDEEETKYISIYEVEYGLIRSVRFVRDY